MAALTSTSASSLWPKGKRGIVFILIALLVTGFLFVLFSGISRIPLDSDVPYTKARISTLNRFAQSFPNQVGIVVRSQAGRAFEGISQTLLSNQSYVASVDDAFTTCIRDGNLAVVGLAGTQACVGMQNQTLPFVLAEFTGMVQRALNANVTYELTPITLSQQSPYEVILVYNLSFTVTDSLAGWNRTVPMRTTVGVEGILDPAFAGTLGTPQYRIKPTSYTQWNTTNLAAFLAERGYRPDPNGTQFLDRYTRAYTPSSCCGLEAVVDPAISSGDNRSAVDRKFFSGYNYDCSTPELLRFKVNDPLFDPAFQLDLEAVIVYGVFNKSERVC